MSKHKKIRKLFWIMLAVLAVSVGVLAVYNQVALRIEADDLIPNGKIVDLGSYSVHVYSEGDNESAPTLVFLSGSSTVAPVYDFKVLYSLLSDEYRIAVVEKAGYGYSDIIDVDRDVATMVNELRIALFAAEIEGPYVLFPHSMSGLEAIYWAQNFPEEVSGIIGIDMAVPDAYDYSNFNMGKTKLIMTLGRLSVGLGLLRIPDIYPLNEAALSHEEVKQQRLLMFRNAVNSVYIAEGNAVCENAKTVNAGGELFCPILMFCSDGTEVGDFWIKIQKEFSEKNHAELICFDCGHYIHHYKSQEMVRHIKAFLN